MEKEANFLDEQLTVYVMVVSGWSMCFFEDCILESMQLNCITLFPRLHYTIAHRTGA